MAQADAVVYNEKECLSPVLPRLKGLQESGKWADLEIKVGHDSPKYVYFILL